MMNQKELLAAANTARPDLMQKTAQAVALLERLAPEFLQDVREDIQSITDVTMEKMADVPNGLLSKTKGIGYSMAAAGGIGLASAIATDLYDAARRGLTKGTNWKRIMDANPGLKNDVRDPARLKPAFNMLHRYAPDFTADPMLGGALLKSLADMPSGNEHTLISNLLGARNNLRSIKNHQFELHYDDKGGKGGGKETVREKKEVELFKHKLQIRRDKESDRRELKKNTGVRGT